MKRLITTLVVLGLVGGLAAVLVQSVAGGSPGIVALPPALTDPSVPSVPEDLGQEERLLLVVAGVYGSREEAETANEQFSFGDVQGFYPVQMGQFMGLADEIPGSGGWALVSAFRTREGAEDFAEIARIAGVNPHITPRFVNRGWAYAGLGQEGNPDGTGPLTGPVPASAPEEE
ncbi:MAG: hypothetical protein WD757_00785 [Actinomycetota bacterium]